MGEKHLGERWLALSRARDIVVWQARRSRSLRSDVYRALRGAGPGAEISTLFGRAAVNATLWAVPRPNRRNYHEENNRIPCRKRWNAGNHCPARAVR